MHGWGSVSSVNSGGGGNGYLRVDASVFRQQVMCDVCRGWMRSFSGRGPNCILSFCHFRFVGWQLRNEVEEELKLLEA